MAEILPPLCNITQGCYAITLRAARRESALLRLPVWQWKWKELNKKGISEEDIVGLFHTACEDFVCPRHDVQSWKKWRRKVKEHPANLDSPEGGHGTDVCVCVHEGASEVHVRNYSPDKVKFPDDSLTFT